MASIPNKLLSSAVRTTLLLALVCAVVAVAWPQREGRAQSEGPSPTLSGAPPAGAPPGGAEGTPSGRRARAPLPPTNVPPEQRIRVYVLTFTPGDHPFYKFGHNAIWIHDETAREPYRRDLVYNYGMFTFGDPALIPKFFLGRFLYWLEPHGLAGTVRGYKKEERGVYAQELDLTMAQELELKRLLEENSLDENKYYKYDYYRDNCSTRVRDMIDRVTDGRLRKASEGKGRLNWREHTSRLTADLVSEYVILNLVMGDLIDQPRTVWEESFIPMELQKVLRTVSVVGDDGVERPLVKAESTLVEPVKPPPLEDPPRRWPHSLVLGALFGGALFGLGRAGVKSRAPRALYGVLMSLAGLMFGFFGVFFLAAWAFTDHEVGYRNENVLLCVPWAFGLVGMGVNIARNRVASATRAEKLVKAAVAAACLGLVLKVLPWFDQDNWLFLAFFVPFWAGAFLGIRELSSKWAGAAISAALPDAPAAVTDPKPKPKPKPAEGKTAAKKGSEAKPADEKPADEKPAKGGPADKKPSDEDAEAEQAKENQDEPAPPDAQ
jgi:hypothetical protein